MAQLVALRTFCVCALHEESVPSGMRLYFPPTSLCLRLGQALMGSVMFSEDWLSLTDPRNTTVSTGARITDRRGGILFYFAL